MKFHLKLFVLAVLLACMASKAHAALGLAREAYGVWDRSGWHSVTNYPYTRGQEYVDSWAVVESSRTNFVWTNLDAQLQFADQQNQKFTVQIEPSGGPVNPNAPSWMTNGPNSVPLFTVPGSFTYADYRNTNYQTYYKEMVQAMATHLRTGVALNLQARVAFVRCDTGSTGDEVPYANSPDASYVQANYPQYYIDSNSTNWDNFRLWAFEVYRHAFQDGTNGPVIPLLFQNIEQVNFPTEWNWVTNNVLGGFGGKYGGEVRGHNLTQAEQVSDSYRQYAVGGNLKIFSRNEMDQTWQNMPMFNTNLPLCMYWCAVEQLHPGLSVWDVSAGCLENTPAGGYADTFSFFNKWSSELDLPTAGGGFCIFHDGLDSSDTNRFPEAIYGAPNPNNTSRYAAICATNAMNGARMDDLYAATKGQVYQRGSQIGFNDSSWQDVPGNYERFITQIQPTNSPGMWRISGATNGVITSASHPFDRFGRRFDHANGKDAMYFDITNGLLTTAGQRVQLSVIYRDTGTGRFTLLYDAVANSQKTAFTVNKGNTPTWKTNTVVVTDWAFANRGPNGADLVLTNLGTEDTIFHSVELVKLANVNVGTVGKGTVSGRTDGTVYSPIMTNNFMERQRLELTVTPAANWKFTGWSGDTNDLTGGDSGFTNTRPFFFPTNGSQLTANFAYVGSGTNTQPLFSSDPINKTPATNGMVYAGTLAGDAGDPGGKLLTFTKVSGPTWLFVATNGVLSGTPLGTDIGLNGWLVRITNGVGGFDDAILLINVSAAPAATIAVSDSTGGSVANSSPTSLTISQAFTVNSGNVLVVNLSYRGSTNNSYPFGPATLNWVTGGGTVTQTVTRAVEAGNTANKNYGSAIYYLWNPNTGSGTISGSLPSTNTAVNIISAFTLTGVDTNTSPIIATNIDNTTANSSITTSTANVPVGGFAALCAGSAGTNTSTGFFASSASGTPVNWFQTNVSSGYWDHGYIPAVAGGNTTFSCAFAGNARLHIVAAVFTPGTTVNNGNLAPVFTSAQMNGSSLIISGTNSSGAAGGTYFLRASTNIVLPIASWSRIFTNTYGAGGAFSVTNKVNLGAPNNFYRLEQ